MNSNLKQKSAPKDQTQNYKSGLKFKIKQPKLSKTALHGIGDNLGET